MSRLSGVLPVALLLPLFLYGCGTSSGGGPAVVMTDSAGVTIVRSTSSTDLPTLLVSDPVRTLGGKDTPEESCYPVVSALVATDDNGNMYVLDPDAYQVQVFDSTGRHLRTLGGQGGGPGELQFPLALAVATDGRAWVADVGKRALVHWGPGGEVLDSDQFPQGYFGGEVKWTSLGLVVPLRDPEGHKLVIASESGENRVLAVLDFAETRALQLESCGMSFSGMEPIFSPNLVWTASRNTVVVARNPAYVIDVYEAGRLVRSVRRDLSPRVASAELAEASLGDGMRVGTVGGERVCDPAEVVEQQGFAAYLPMVSRLALAPEGTLWVQRYDVGESPQPIDIFNPEGQYVGTLPYDAPFPVGFLPDGRILVSERDELDVERLVVRSAELDSPRQD